MNFPPNIPQTMPQQPVNVTKTSPSPTTTHKRGHKHTHTYTHTHTHHLETSFWESLQAYPVINQNDSHGTTVPMSSSSLQYCQIDGPSHSAHDKTTTTILSDYREYRM